MLVRRSPEMTGPLPCQGLSLWIWRIDASRSHVSPMPLYLAIGRGVTAAIEFSCGTPGYQQQKRPVYQ